jgi:hypothetical protein
MPDLGRVSQIDSSAYDAASAYVSVKKALLEDHAPYIFRTHDYGRTWTKIVTGIKANDYISSVREDPVRKGLLYAGAEHGFYVSMDDGDRWQSLSLNLPDTQVSDIWVEGGDIAIATHGRAFWILDDVNPLRQYQAAATATDAYLFKPGDAIRAGGAANISYWLKKPAGKMTLDILDSKNQVVRSFTGALPNAGRGRAGGASAGRGGQPATAAQGGATPTGGVPQTVPGEPAPDAGRGGAEGEVAPDDTEGGGGRGRGGPPPSIAAGLQRFAWDLQAAPVVQFPGMVLWGATQNGPLVVPGTYQARLTVDGRAQSQAFAVKKHPYHTATEAEMQEQYDIAIQIRDKVNEANNAIIQIRRIKQALLDRESKSTNADVKEIAEQLIKELTAVEVDVYQVKNQSNQDPLNFPIKTNNRLASLLRVVESGDGKPTGNTVPIFNDLKIELKGETDRLQKTLSTYLPRFNQLAQRLGLEQISEK